MRALTRWVVLSLIVVTGWSFGQQAAPEKPPSDKGTPKRTLDEQLAAALRHSPDVQVADAKVREAQVELRRTRLTLIQRVIEANAAVETAHSAVTQADAAFKRVSRLAQSGAVTQDELEAAQDKLAAPRGHLAQAESTLNALTGTLPGASGALTGDAAGGSDSVPETAGSVVLKLSNGVPTAPMADKLRTALSATIKVSAIKDKPLAEVINSFRPAAGGVPFLLQLGDDGKVPISVSLEGDVQVGAAFQALEDVVPGLVFYVREYGILVKLENPVPVAGAMPLVDFWRKHPSGK